MFSLISENDFLTVLTSYEAKITIGANLVQTSTVTNFTRFTHTKKLRKAFINKCT